MNKGLVFDIQRFSVNDGPGIRTTVFFKGCGLRCRWCHNPESIASYIQLSYDPSRCNGCGKCVDFVQGKGITLDNGKAIVDMEIHDQNLALIDVCPKKAFGKFGDEITVEDLVNEVMKDKDYYETSHGGVTFSGGEALNQWPFIQACAIELKKRNIHLTLDASGNDPAKLIGQTTDWIDLYLVDYKLSDDSKYEKYVGRRFDPKIMLETLMEVKKDVVLRCVLIPGINDTEDHFKQIALIQATYPNIKQIDLLPYHKLRKKQVFHLVNEREFYEVADEQVKEYWINQIKAQKIRNVMLENKQIY